MQQAELFVRYARLADAGAISAITAEYARKGIMLERSDENIIENIRNFFVAEYNGEVIGCCAIAFYTQKLAEIRSLAVFNRFTMKGIGRLLVEKAETVLREEGVTEVFVLTLNRNFFGRIGYSEIRKEYFPQKIWRDCTHCPKLMACDEIAMVKKL
ncbi:N-acetyltransferase [Chlorobium sp. BLA1]|uniref:N-acetyltransferase n=1 Tax=Candidatus Chlorobium masyuteum TaxID=2716876 RepID=UPI00141DDF84|nr:N-acetyltransferase [Candidatus Chlorobium masyuteum]NHQ59473.1 N-acetyltransferase [Candidatus Chlorobium masyuteum]NTU45228.1 N-acetyltransferase [Chlorobiaceae bacterium]